MKRIAMVCLMTLMVVILFAGCGVPQAEVDEQVAAARIEGYNDGEEAGYEEGYQAGYDAYADPANPGPVIVELNALIAELEEEKAALEAEIEELTPQEVELKYDDGTADRFLAIGREPGTGYLIDFTPPATPFILTKIRIFGNLFGSSQVYENQEFTVEIWDKNQKIIWTASYPHTAKFTLTPEWAEIEVPEVSVSGDFYVHVFTCSNPDGGITIGHDSSIPNEHSEMTKEWRIERWSMGSTPQSEVNWMIRVVGTIEE